MNRTKKKTAYTGLYGHVALQKAYCDDCGGVFIVIEGILQCCGEEVNDVPERYKREIEASAKTAFYAFERTKEAA
jgi:hypothetical protein